MGRTLPSRKLAKRALRLVREDPKRGLALVPAGENGITPDAVLMFIKLVDKIRDAKDLKREEYVLRSLVRDVCRASPLESGREYAYQLVVMRYYSILSSFAAERRRRWKKLRTETRAKRTRRETVSPPFELVP